MSEHARHLATNTDAPSCDACRALNHFMETWNDFVLDNDDAQAFVQINNLAPATCPRVWFRYFGPDFMADVVVTKPGNKRSRRLKATGKSIHEALASLAHEVASYLHPVRP